MEINSRRKEKKKQKKRKLKSVEFLHHCVYTSKCVNKPIAGRCRHWKAGSGQVKNCQWRERVLISMPHGTPNTLVCVFCFRQIIFIFFRPPWHARRLNLNGYILPIYLRPDADWGVGPPGVMYYPYNGVTRGHDEWQDRAGWAPAGHCAPRGKAGAKAYFCPIYTCGDCWAPSALHLNAVRNFWYSSLPFLITDSFFKSLFFLGTESAVRFTFYITFIYVFFTTQPPKFIHSCPPSLSFSSPATVASSFRFSVPFMLYCIL